MTLVSEEIPNDFTDETLANDDTKIVKEVKIMKQMSCSVSPCFHDLYPYLPFLKTQVQTRNLLFRHQSPMDRFESLFLFQLDRLVSPRSSTLVEGLEIERTWYHLVCSISSS